MARCGWLKLSEILSQAEIEALLNTLPPDGADGPETPIGPTQLSTPRSKLSLVGGGGKSGTGFEVYDFRHPDKFSKEQLRTIQMLHETFARLAGSQLSAYLRTHVSIDLISLEQVPYEEYLRGINQSVFAVLSLPPLTGQAVMEMEFGLMFTIIDRLLGGPGRTVNRTVISEIERPLIKQVIERMFVALKTSWEGVVVVNPGVEGMETSSQFVQIAPPTDIVVTILFEVKIGQTRGALSLCIPYLVLKPVTAKLSVQKWFVSTNRKHNPASRRAIAKHLQQAMVDCTLLLGHARMKVREFLQLKAGDVVRLDQKANRDLTFLVNQTEKFEGRPALNGSKLVLKVSHTIEK